MRISDWSSDVCSSDLPPSVRVSTASGNVPFSIPRGAKLDPLVVERALNHPVDIDAGRMNMIGIEASSRHDLLDLRDRHSAGSRHVGIEVTSGLRSEEHTSELQSLMRISYAVFCLKKKNKRKTITNKI